MITSPSAATLLFHSDRLWQSRLAQVVAANLSFVLVEAKRDAVLEVESALIGLGITDGRYDVFFDRMAGAVQGLIY